MSSYEIPESVVLTKLDELVGWGRKNSLWPLPFGTACCAIEFMGTVSSEYDVSRFGAELVRFSPRQADMMLVMGTVNYKMAPVLQKIYNQMCEPKWVVAVGACASCGGFYDNYHVVQGIDQLIPVDVYVAGCPPRPENILGAILKLQEQVKGEYRHRSGRKHFEKIEIDSGNTFVYIPPAVPAPVSGGNTRTSTDGPDSQVLSLGQNSKEKLTPIASVPQSDDANLFSAWTV